VDQGHQVLGQLALLGGNAEEAESHLRASSEAYDGRVVEATPPPLRGPTRLSFWRGHNSKVSRDRGCTTPTEIAGGVGSSGHGEGDGTARSILVGLVGGGGRQARRKSFTGRRAGERRDDLIVLCDLHRSTRGVGSCAVSAYEGAERLSPACIAVLSRSADDHR
jgi:hypothetical protein